MVGGGNSAIDAARTAKRLGANVTLVYRRTREEMPADESEVNEAEREGITISLLQNIKSVKSENDYLEVELINMKLGDYDSSGRRRPVENPGSNFTRKIDSLILSIGQTPALSGLFNDGEMSLNRNQTIPTEKGITKIKDVFAGDNEIFIQRYCSSQSIFHYILKNAKPVLMDFQRYRKMLSYGYIEPWDVMTNTHLWLAVPIKDEQKVIGVLALQSYNNARLYSEKDIDLLEFVAQQLSAAILRKSIQDNIEKERITGDLRQKLVK